MWSREARVTPPGGRAHSHPRATGAEQRSRKAGSGGRATCRDEAGNSADSVQDDPQTTKCPKSQHSEHKENHIYASSQTSKTEKKKTIFKGSLRDQKAVIRRTTMASFQQEDAAVTDASAEPGEGDRPASLLCADALRR